MELIKKEIGMECIVTEKSIHPIVEEDFNISDTKPDVGRICTQEGRVCIEDIRLSKEFVTIEGRLEVSVLYLSEENCRPVAMSGSISFVEQAALPASEKELQCLVYPVVEDLQVSVINSRKLGIRSVLELKITVTEESREQLPVQVQGEEEGEYKRVEMNVLETALQKKDLLRIRKEIPISAGFPNIGKLLWNNVQVEEWNYKAMDGRIKCSGEIRLFVVYEAESENGEAKYYETTFPFEEITECRECTEDSFLLVTPLPGTKQLESRADEDGEERLLGLDMGLDLRLEIYGQQTENLLVDAYGVEKEVKVEQTECSLQRPVFSIVDTLRIDEKLPMQQPVSGKATLLHCEGEVISCDTSITDKGILVRGGYRVKAIFSAEEMEGCFCVEGVVPYQTQLLKEELLETDDVRIRVQGERIQMFLVEGSEPEVKAHLSVHCLILRHCSLQLPKDIRVEDMDLGLWNELPTMLIYRVKEGDTLWDIGKKYYLSTKKIAEVNYMTGEEIAVGQKLLLVRGL